MSENNCDSVIQENNKIQESVFKNSLNTALKGTSLGNARSHINKLNTQVEQKLDGTNNRNSYFDQTLWNRWKNNWYLYTRESFENIKTIKMLDEAIISRHKALRGIESPDYNVDCTNNVINVMENFRNKEENDFDKLNNYMNTLLTSYKHLFDYKSSVKAIYNEKFNRLANIQNKIDTYKQNLFMDERKNKYEYNSYDFYKSAHFFVLIIYFSLLALYLIFSDFIKEQRYKERKNIIALISYVITPFLLAYILDNIYKIYIFILEFNNIRDDVISYPYIVNKFNKTDHEI